MPTDKEQQAQKARSRRYNIQIREKGNVTKPEEWSSLRDSQFGDPVNYLFPVPDESHAKNAKSRFAQFKGNYNGRSRSVVRGRLNRLLRKFDVEPIENDDGKEEEEFSQNVDIGGPIMLEEGEDDNGILIPAARVATLNHPWYGTLWFDDDLFDSFQDNFETNVIGTDLIVDAEHGRNGMLGDMALGWVDRVFTENGIFNMHARKTELGQDHLGTSYRYASITYHPNWQDQETGIEYGPTLMGVAATNHPFVHRNAPIENSFTTTPGGVYYFMPPTGLYTTVTASTDTVDVSINPTQEGDDMSDNLQGEGGETTPLATSPPEPTPTEFLTMPDGTTLSAQNIAAMMKRTEDLARQLKQAEIERVCNEASDRGVPPFFIGIARQFMEHCEPDAEATITLNTGEPDEEARQFNFFHGIAHLLRLSPGRIGEVTFANTGTPPPEKAQTGNIYLDEPEDLSPEKAEEMARKRRQELGIKATQDVEL